MRGWTLSQSWMADKKNLEIGTRLYSCLNFTLFVHRDSMPYVWKCFFIQCLLILGSLSCFRVSLDEELEARTTSVLTFLVTHSNPCIFFY